MGGGCSFWLVWGNAGQGDRGAVGRHPALRLWSSHWVCKLHAPFASRHVSTWPSLLLRHVGPRRWPAKQSKRCAGTARGGHCRTSTVTVHGGRREISHFSARRCVLTLSARPRRVASGTIRILSVPYSTFACAPLKVQGKNVFHRPGLRCILPKPLNHSPEISFPFYSFPPSPFYLIKTKACTPFA